MGVGPVGAFGRWLASHVPALDQGHKLRAREFEPEKHRYYERTWEFDLAAGATLELPWVKIDVSAGGAPTLDYVTGASSGAYRLKFHSTSEVENVGLYFGDHKPIVCNFTTGDEGPVFEFVATITPSATYAGDMAIGLSGDRGQTSSTAADLDTDVTNYMRFRIDGNLSLLCQTDDGVTATSADTGLDIATGTAATTLRGRIDATVPEDVKFFVMIEGTHTDFVRVCASTTFDMSGDDFSFQPHIEHQKAANATVHQLDVDTVSIRHKRPEV